MILPGVVRAVFFDAVGTLIHPEPPAALVYAQVASRFGSVRTAAEIGPRFRAAFARQEARDAARGWRVDEAHERQRWREIVAEVLDDATDPDGCFETLWEHFSRPESWRCPPEAAATLAALAQRGYLLGLASNYDSRLHRVVAGRPELAAIEPVVISSEVGWRKPAGEFYAAVRQAAGLKIKEILYVGDNVANDYEGARAAGLWAILFDPAVRYNDRGWSRVARLDELVQDGSPAQAGEESWGR
jgi:putative hydrolase of the HAD superfamily